ncbi:MAG: protein kinase [Lachnospiraceae bacterium]|nr:protein kinase [Lachnospiraceae bacterium]
MSEKYPLALPEGTVLAGKYVLERVLGQGGFGITYQAVEYETNLKVAIKEFFPDAMVTRTGTTVTSFSGERQENFNYGKSCFLQEAETLAEFSEVPGIVHVLGYFEENDTAYFVMDFVEGESFEEFIRRNGGRVDYPTTEKILLPVMEALAQVHDKGIIHRDVTPDNIFITESGDVKLIDFGAARYSLGDKSQSLDIVLKHGFAPKEQYSRRGKQGPFTDVYSMGATFYFALTGQRPPDAIDRLERDEMVRPSAMGVQITPDQESALLMALAVIPENRFQGMRVFKNALTSVKEQSSINSYMQPQQVPSPMAPSVPASGGTFVPNGYIPTTGNQPMTASTPVSSEQKKKKIWPIFVIIGGVVAAAAVVLVLLFTKWGNAYKEANALYAQEKYEEAAKAFDAISFYKDAKKQAEASRDMVKKKDAYEDAESYMNAGKYEKALDSYETAKGYLDASDRAELIKDMFSYEESGNLRKAHEILLSKQMGLSSTATQKLEDSWYEADKAYCTLLSNNCVAALNDNLDDNDIFLDQIFDELDMTSLQNSDSATQEFLLLMNAKSGWELVNRLSLPNASGIIITAEFNEAENTNYITVWIQGTDISY